MFLPPVNSCWQTARDTRDFDLLVNSLEFAETEFFLDRSTRRSMCHDRSVSYRRDGRLDGTHVDTAAQASSTGSTVAERIS